jgi:hypothetical protein
VIQTVREKFSCRKCETITQPPAPFHVTPRGFAGPNLLAMVLFEKFGQHQPLNRQSERYRREGIDLSLSTPADQVGACTTVLQRLFALIAHRRAGRRWSKLAEWLRPARPSHGELAWRVEPMVAEERTAPQKEGFRTLPSLPLPRRKSRLMPARLQVDA